MNFMFIISFITCQAINLLMYIYYKYDVCDEYVNLCHFCLHLGNVVAEGSLLGMGWFLSVYSFLFSIRAEFLTLDCRVSFVSTRPARRYICLLTQIRHKANSSDIPSKFIPVYRPTSWFTLCFQPTAVSARDSFSILGVVNGLII